MVAAEVLTTASCINEETKEEVVNSESQGMCERPQSRATSPRPPPMGVGEDLPPQVPQCSRTRRDSPRPSFSKNPSTPVLPGEYYRRWFA
jgi:hypothetical protein